MASGYLGELCFRIHSGLSPARRPIAIGTWSSMGAAAAALSPPWVRC
ncbi:hypothetical protein [Streptomyces sp. NBC_00280]